MQVQGEKSEKGQENKGDEESVVHELQRQVDELTEANRLLQEQLARKEQFTAMIAHDLRGPLSPIINYAQMLARHKCAPGEGKQTGQAAKNAAIKRQTSIIVSQARRMNRLVNDLLDASRLSSGQFSLRRKHCDMVQLVKEMIEELRPVAPYHTFVLKSPDKELTGYWDCGRLQQALGNLLDNAIKYSDERTNITVSISEGEQSVCVNVHNQGVSIPPDEIGQLFRPYTRLAATSDRQGSGLGLFITKSIIDAHDGDLRLEPHGTLDSNGEPLQGTMFTFELPLPKTQAKK